MGMIGWLWPCLFGETNKQLVADGLIMLRDMKDIVICKLDSVPIEYKAHWIHPSK
jgi:hypothetical protein